MSARCCADCAALRAWRALLDGGDRTGAIFFERATVRAELRIGPHAVSSRGVSLADAVRDVALVAGEADVVLALDAEREALRRAATIAPPGHVEGVTRHG